MTTAITKADDCGCDDGDEFAAVTAHDDTEPDAKPDPRGKKVTRWKSLLAPIGKPTGDKRRFASNALTNRELPVALKWQRSDNSGHSQSVVVGTVDKITYAKDGTPTGEGLLFTPDPEQLPRLAEDVNEFKMLAKSGTIGPSVDLDDMDFTVDQPEGEMAKAEPGQPEKRPGIEVTKGRISAVTMVPIPAFAETAPTFEMFEVDPEEMETDTQPAVTAAGVRSHGWKGLPKVERDWDALEAVERVRAWAGDDAEAFKLAFLYDDGARQLFPVADVVDGQLVVVPEALTAAADILEAGHTDVPDTARMAMLDLLDHIQGDWWFEDAPLFTDADLAVLTAGATTIDVDALPPADWFHDPKLEGPTAITVTPDGRVFGHLAEWGTCHTGMPGACITPPKSKSQYAYFHTGEVLTEEGPVAVGRVSLGGGHADTRLGFRAATEHYDSTSTCVATVRAGQDEHGIWIAGSIVPGLDAYKVAELRRSPLSGDWRRVGGRLELVHALAVNSGGFPVPRASMVASGMPGELVQNALVAAGTLSLGQGCGHELCGGDGGACPACGLNVATAAGAPDLAATVAGAVQQGIAAYRAAEVRKGEAARLLSDLETDFAASAEVRARAKARRLLGAF